ncbi:uncharacterized protein BT62DRAFT_93699 [Guyanagaster necrorhizus]|uniref:Uncharacterized protein n=1 Tax=Guyanagaster necrorhizus TaxID=856835 RepID=A0A9P7VU01_9AGAR|nr:uncharacterized protein BT62DRAFT_93699 [Guyanagaster necrorhizus MCA 3950]KAG7446919.1 hypothetical protein BT62DRAFT_93699 [Guyanagaster necrorhizus MCA 3950]
MKSRPEAPSRRLRLCRKSGRAWRPDARSCFHSTSLRIYRRETHRMFVAELGSRTLVAEIMIDRQRKSATPSWPNTLRCQPALIAVLCHFGTLTFSTMKMV